MTVITSLTTPITSRMSSAASTLRRGFNFTAYTVKNSHFTLATMAVGACAVTVGGVTMIAGGGVFTAGILVGLGVFNSSVGIKAARGFSSSEEEECEDLMARGLLLLEKQGWIEGDILGSPEGVIRSDVVHYEMEPGHVMLGDENQLPPPPSLFCFPYNPSVPINPELTSFGCHVHEKEFEEPNG